MYTAFGSKPSRTRNSAGALAKRARAVAGLPRINVLVDVYDAISVAHLIPRAGGEEIVEHPRWNSRRGPRTRLTEQTTSGIFLLKGMAPMPVAETEDAAAELAELAELLGKFSPAVRITVRSAAS